MAAIRLMRPSIVAVISGVVLVPTIEARSALEIIEEISGVELAA